MWKNKASWQDLLVCVAYYSKTEDKWKKWKKKDYVSFSRQGVVVTIDRNIVKFIFYKLVTLFSKFLKLFSVSRTSLFVFGGYVEKTFPAFFFKSEK